MSAALVWHTLRGDYPLTAESDWYHGSRVKNLPVGSAILPRNRSGQVRELDELKRLGK